MSQFVFLSREAFTPSPQELESRMARCLAWFKELEQTVTSPTTGIR
jgi:hypothetical protein